MNYDFLKPILDPIIAAGPLFMIFIVFSITGLIVGLKLLKAIRNGLMIAVGFGGVYIVVDYFLAKIGPAALALATRFGGVFTITDVGWAANAAIAWGSPWAYVIVVLLIALNLVMIVTRMTDTLNLNIWDFWENIFGFLVVYAITQNITLSLICSLAFGWFSLIMTDFFAQQGYTEALGFTGLSFYQGSNVIWGPVGHYMAKLLDKIGLKDVNWTPEKIQERFGVIGEPAVLGGIMGLLMGIGAGFYWIDIVMLSISLATALVLIPMMSGIVMQALVPVTEAAATFMKKSASGRQLFIGVDPAIAVGNTTNLALVVLMIPVMLVLAFIIPGVVMLPLADLPSLLFMWIFLIAPNRFDMLRSFITAIVVGIFITILGIWVAPWSTLVAKMQGLDIPAGTGISSMVNAATPELFVAGVLGENYARIGYFGVVAVLVIAIGISIVFRLRYLKNKKAAVAA
jgi:galactitol PTS system EIIC component